MSGAELGPVGIGVVVPHDFALDAELWRWLPPGATLYLTRLPTISGPVSVDVVAAMGEPGVVGTATTEVLTPEPAVVAFGCTSGSFVNGRQGEQDVVRAMLDAGAPAAVTTSGAMLEAMAALGLGRVAVATPYPEPVGVRLRAFLQEAGVEVVAEQHLGRDERIWTVGLETTKDLIRRVAGDGGDGVFVSCTNLPTFDAIADLESELGVPVITANQVTMWAALGRAGLRCAGPGQRLTGVGFAEGG